MNESEEPDELDNKMLYELNNIHTWSCTLPDQPPTSLQALHSVYNQYLGSNRPPLLKSPPTFPVISHDGEYVLLATDSSLHIRDKHTNFSLLRELQMELGRDSVVVWSCNSPHFAVSTADRVQVYDVEGNRVHEEIKMPGGTRISSLFVWVEEGEMNCGIVSGNRVVMYSLRDGKTLGRFEFGGEVVSLVPLSNCSKFVSIHLNSTG